MGQGVLTVWIGIKIVPRKEVLDVQGRAIAEALLSKKYPVQSCTYGKFLKLKLNIDDPDEALKIVREMVESLLCNSLVESYDVEILSK